MRQLLWIATGVALSVAAVAASQVVEGTFTDTDAKAAAVSERSADLVAAPAASAIQRSLAAQPAAAGPTVDDVGDTASFGRNATWLGVVNGFVALADACAPEDTSAGTACFQLAPAPAATSFVAEDLVRIRLPAKASKSLLCHWFSPAVTVGYANAGATPVVASLSYTPTLTVENEVLLNPALIDPTTGVPFNGRLTASMTATERFEVPLPAGTSLVERQRDTATCIAGFISQRGLMNSYGLTEAQAKEFMKKPMTVRLNVSGVARHVDYAQFVMGLRIMGD